MEIQAVSGQEVQERPPRSSGTWVQVSEQRHARWEWCLLQPRGDCGREGSRQGLKSGTFLTPSLPHAQPTTHPPPPPVQAPPPSRSYPWVAPEEPFAAELPVSTHICSHLSFLKHQNEIVLRENQYPLHNLQQINQRSLRPQCLC